MAVVMILLVAGAVSAHRPLLVLLMIAGVSSTVLAVARLIPQSVALSVTIATCSAIYTTAFAGAVLAVFQKAHWAGVAAAFLLPLLGLVLGVAWQRQTIRARLTQRRHQDRQRILLRGMGWLLLCFGIGAAAVALVPVHGDVASATFSLVIAMTVISVTTVVFAADIACLLDETGALFRLFLVRMLARIVPIFSFLIVFLFIGALFATLYAILDHHSATPAFAVGGTPTTLTLPDTIYFSFVTLSTIGYGDITAIDAIARTLVIAEIIFGVVLLLFAFAEIAAYDPEKDLDAAEALEDQERE
jgi:hypothetical protein